MKKTVLFATVVAIISLVSCKKEEISPISPDNESQVQRPEFVASINIPDSKTAINVADGKVSWDTTDEISVTSTKDAVSKTAIYKIKSIDELSGKATFQFKSGDDIDTGVGVSYSAKYGEKPETVQLFQASAKNLYMTASGSGENNELTFSVQCGLLKLNLTAISGEPTKVIKRIEVTGVPEGGIKTTYTLNCTDESISSAKDFFIALPAGTYTDIVCYNSINCVYPMHATTSLEVSNNHISPVKFTKVVFNLLPGEFSVSGTKKVRFAKGNLKWDSSSWTVYANQYDCDKALQKDLFWWTNYSDYNGSNASRKPYSKAYSHGTLKASDPFFCESAHPLSVNGTESLYTLTQSEWVYLLNTRPNISKRYVRNGTNIKVNGVSGVILVPDVILHGYSFDSTKNTYTAAEWGNAQDAGLVFLPLTGRYNPGGGESGKLPNNYFSYWTASSANDSSTAISLDQQDNSTELFLDESYRESARPLRLVSTIK